MFKVLKGGPMDERLQSIYDSVPDPVSRSRLEPYRELILRWWRRGHSYRGICKLLSEKCGVGIGRTALQEFIQRRSRPRQVQPELQNQPVVVGDPSDREPLPVEVVGLRPRLSPEERVAQREAIRAAYNKPVVPQEAPKKLFVYDPDKPPINKNY
jgi:hypothetical protein